jgi:hypothetical protein
VQARSLMQRARAEHFAVGAFNVDNQETLLAIVRVAQVKDNPRLSRRLAIRDAHPLAGRQLPLDVDGRAIMAARHRVQLAP